MIVLKTHRLTLSHLSGDDAPFILRLVNEPAFIRYIGDKGVRTLEDALEYLMQGPVASYSAHGFGMYRVTLNDGGAPIGICGLIRRDGLDDVDIGFAFLPEYWGCGYASESAQAVMQCEPRSLGLRRVVAITDPDNVASIRVVEKLGLRFERMVRLADDAAEVKLFSIALDPAADSDSGVQSSKQGDLI